MTLQECYTKLEGDYTGVLARLMREASIAKFLVMMLKDTQLEEFHKGLENSDFETAFRAVHTLKGTALNLGITKLALDASTVTEALRGGDPKTDITDMVTELEDEYYKTMRVITEFNETKEN